MAPRLSPRNARRYLFLCTLCLSCTLLCYNLILRGGHPSMHSRGYQHLSCPPVLGGKKLLQKVLLLCPHSGAALTFSSTDLPSYTDWSGKNQTDPLEIAGTPAKPTGHPTGNSTAALRYGHKRLPQAIIVGVKKGGTRAVLEFIRVHPEVRAMGTEPHFFDRNYEMGLDWYR